MNNKIYIIQPSLPKYREDFFNRLYSYFKKNLLVVYSLDSKNIKFSKSWLHHVGRVKNILGIFFWQPEVITLRFKPKDIIILSGNPRFFSTLFLLLKAKLIGSKVVWWGHYRSSSTQRWRQILRFFFMAIADSLIFYTDEEIKNFKTDKFTLNKNRYITALNNGIDIAPVKKFRKKYISNKRLNELLFIGSLTKKANLKISLYALFLLKNKNLTLHIVGDGEQRQKLHSLSKKLSLDKFVVWHGSIMNEEKIAKIANRCKGFLYPGAVGLSLIHAMAYGLPALVHEQRNKHMPEIAAFKSGKTGLVFRYNNINSLVLKIKKILSNDLNNDLYSQKAIKIVEANYNTAVMAERFISLIKKIKKRYNIV